MPVELLALVIPVSILCAGLGVIGIIEALKRPRR